MARIDDLKREARHVPDELHYAEPEAGNGGWVRMAYTDSPAVLYARFEMRGGGLHLTEVYMRSADCVSGPEASKRIERVTQFVAAMGAHERARFIDRMAVPGPRCPTSPSPSQRRSRPECRLPTGSRCNGWASTPSTGRRTRMG